MPHGIERDHVTRQNRFVAKGFLHNVILITYSDFVSIARFPRKGLWLASHRSVMKAFVAGGVAAAQLALDLDVTVYQACTQIKNDSIRSKS